VKFLITCICFLLCFVGGCSTRQNSYTGLYPLAMPSMQAYTHSQGSPPELYTNQNSPKPYVVRGKVYQPLRSAHGYVEEGTASWYGAQFHGKKTASGERFNKRELTAAHPVLPLGSVVTVTNLNNGNAVRVRINDRGPFTQGRIIDLSKAAAAELGILNRGTARVRVQTASAPQPTQMQYNGIQNTSSQQANLFPSPSNALKLHGQNTGKSYTVRTIYAANNAFSAAQAQRTRAHGSVHYTAARIVREYPLAKTARN
jgi:rare lipoprotein A